MTTRISINMIDGARFANDEDKQRAADAALMVLSEAGVSVEDAFAEFKAQWAEFDDYDKMTGNARLWVKAEEAANCALTEGWANTEGASCGISA